ncbi:hypothetical protein J7K28_03945 [Candidatus Aerophobetes bacterium]|nr:hypothetical protein [Candidatus Aerophobetes bacterium]
MKKIVLGGILLFILSTSGWTQEEPLPTELPTIIVKGKDKSYLEIIRKKTTGIASRTYLPEKKLTLPSLSPSLGEKTPPPLEKEKIDLVEKEKRPLPSLKSRAPSPLPHISPQIPSLSYNFTGERFISLPQREEKETVYPSPSEKKLSFPSPQVSLGEKIFPVTKEKSSFPYLHLYTYLATQESFSYQLNYGRSLKEFSYFLSFHRDYLPFEIKYRGEILDKDTDGVVINSSWNLPKKKKSYLELEKSREKIGLSEQKEIDKEKLRITGGQKLENFLIEGEIGNFRISYPYKDEEWEGSFLRTSAKLRVKGTSLSIGLNFNRESLNSNSTQTHFWLRGDGLTFSQKKNLVLTVRTGVKWVEDEEAQFLPYFKILYLINPQMRIQITGERMYFLPDCEKLYLDNDYTLINTEEEFLLTPRDLWDYRISWNYEFSPRMNLSLEGFLREGRDIIWNEEDFLIKPLDRKILLQGGRAKFWHCFNDNFQQEIIYTYQKIRNTEEGVGIPERVVPGYPQTKGELWLRWENDDWKIEVGGETIGERYYREDTMEVLPSGWKEKLRISKNLGKDVKCSIEWQRNNYEVLKDYHLPPEKFILEIKARLF